MDEILLKHANTLREIRDRLRFDIIPNLAPGTRSEKLTLQLWQDVETKLAAAEAAIPLGSLGRTIR